MSCILDNIGDLRAALTALGVDVPSSSVTPGGSDHQLQFNDNGALGGIPQVIYDDSTGELGLDPTGFVSIKNIRGTVQTDQAWRFTSRSIESVGTIASFDFRGTEAGGNATYHTHWTDDTATVTMRLWSAGNFLRLYDEDGGNDTFVGLWAVDSDSLAVTFGTDAAATQGYLSYNNDNNSMALATNATPWINIDSGQNATFAQFPVLPTADPDADYEAATKKYVDDNAGGSPGGSDTQVQYNKATVFDGIPGFTYNGSLTRHVNPFYFGDSSTKGIIRLDRSSIDATNPALCIEDTVDRSAEGSGDPTLIITNTAEAKDLFGFTHRGEFWFGKGTFNPQTRHVLSFLATDAVLSGGVSPSVGILGYVTHALASAETHAKLMGIHGHAQCDEDTGIGTTVSGLRGTAGGGDDAVGYSSKYLAGVLGSLGGDGAIESLQGDIDTPLSVSVGGVAQIPAGDWKVAAPFMASFITPEVAGGMPMATVTNKPDIVASMRVVIQGWSATTGEQWAIYGEAPETGVPKTPDVGGFMHITYPRRGTSHKMHFRFETTDTDAWPGGALGDVKFDDGTTTVEGLWEHDGTAWRFMPPQISHSTDITTGSGAQLGNQGPNSGFNQAGWVELKVDDGTAGGRTVRVPYWQ